MTRPALPDNHWTRAGFLVLDLETTGVDVETALIASISAGDLRPEAMPRISTDYIAVDMPEEAAKVNGLDTAFLRSMATTMPTADLLASYVRKIADTMLAGRPVVIANAPYDLTVLDRECRRHGVRTLSDRMGDAFLVVDPIVLDKRAIKYRKRVSKDQGARQLKTLCQVHGVGWVDASAHTSEYDAVQAGRVTWQILRGFPTLAAMSLPDLHAAQVRWYAEQSEGLALWFAGESVKRKQLAKQALRSGDDVEVDRLEAEAQEFRGKAVSVDTAWPLRPYVEVPPRPVTDEEFADLPILDPSVLPPVCPLSDCGCSGLAHP